jgi:G3E family GTPase
MIPITIVTGYLGSGKTTLLNCILRQNHGKKIAVIENEFGEKNIDYEFVLHEKEQIFQMSNGCICCNVREDLITTLKAILEFTEGFDAIVIETTGVADPSPILHTLKQDPVLLASFEIDSIICLIDAKNILVQLDRSPEVLKQLTAANLVLLNKIDIISNTDELNKIEETIVNLNPECEILKTTKSEVLIEDVFLKNLFKIKNAVPKFMFRAKDKIKNTTHELNISSKYIEFSGEISHHFFSIWLDLLFYQYKDNIYRMKGVLSFKNEPHKIYFQAVHDYVELSKADLWGTNEERVSQIVVIGKELDFSLIESGFLGCVK